MSKVSSGGNAKVKGNVAAIGYAPSGAPMRESKGKVPAEGKAGEKLKVSKANKLKLAGLLAFIVLTALIAVLIWPYIGELFKPGGINKLVQDIRGAGIFGVLILEGLQFLQIIVAFIPGEITQIAAGMIYGPWLGALLILVGCVISSAFVFLLVHKLGAPFVHEMVPAKYMDKFRQFENSGKFTITVFVLFLIPGMPKDVFTYITPLSNMKLVPFLLVTNIGRIPGIVLSTYAASGLLEGRIWESVVIFVALAVASCVGLAVYNKYANK